MGSCLILHYVLIIILCLLFYIVFRWLLSLQLYQETENQFLYVEISKLPSHKAGIWALFCPDSRCFLSTLLLWIPCVIMVFGERAHVFRQYFPISLTVVIYIHSRFQWRLKETSFMISKILMRYCYTATKMATK